MPSVSFNNLPFKDKTMPDYDPIRISPALVLSHPQQNHNRPTTQSHPHPSQQKVVSNFAHLAQAQIQGQQNFFLGSNTLDGISDDRKLVNVSIDLINDPQTSDLAADDMQSTA